MAVSKKQLPLWVKRAYSCP